MTFQVKAEVLLNNSNWEKNLRKTSKQLDGFGTSLKTINRFVKGFVAFEGFRIVGDAIMDVTKAASEDAKSTALLNKQMDNTWKASKKTKDEMAAYVDKVSNLSAIQDDKLRPALSKIVSVTKNATKAQKYFSMALDVSAGTGKDVNSVSQAFAKFLGGNKTALDKLVPGLKNAGDKMKFLQDKYAGMAAVAGNNDPFARITVVMDNFKEKLGTAFLPVVQKFADWLASPDAQKSLDDIAKKVQRFGEWFASPEGQKSFKGWMRDLRTMIKLAGDFLGLVENVSNLLRPASKKETNKVSHLLFTGQPATSQNIARNFQTGSGNFSTAGTKVYQTIHVTATQASGKDVINAITAYARGKGIPMSKLLR